jgi:4-alpha-glucanotransferase
MKHINLILGCHSHQPVGNLDFVFEEAYEKCYRPFVDVLEKYPAVRFTMHYTGPLWDWFLANTPDYVTRLATLAQQGQVEIMGGGYYEPLLCAIPERDARAQIESMSAFCEEHLGVKPRGMWLTERVWEPHMAKILAESGVEYAALDDAHFLCSGLRPEDLYGYYMTEEEGHVLKVFPIEEKLRYLVPFHTVEETISHLRGLATEDGTRCAVLHDDGEKFGVWPGTFSSVYEEGWLESFFQALTDNQDWLHSVTYSEHLDSQRPLGRTYITCASYQEMMAWALPTARQRELKVARERLEEQPELNARCAPFMRGGFWRNFLSKYPEANNMQKRMLRGSRRLEKLKGKSQDPLFEKARQHLHRGQCNCAYWHGQFGGLYLNHLRTAIYEEIIQAENVMDILEGPLSPSSVECVDFDGDGQNEYVLENEELGVFVSPHDGGTIFELDYKRGAFNLLNTLARREEPYHDALADANAAPEEEDGGAHSIHEPFQAKESGLDAYLFQDLWRRASLRDHLYAMDTDVETLYRNEATELADLAQCEYRSIDSPNSIILEAKVPLGTYPVASLKIRKTLRLCSDETGLEIAYDIESDCPETISACFSPEIVVNLLTGSASDRYYHSDERDLARPMLGTRAIESSLRHFALRDEWKGLETGFRLEEPVDWAVYPIETVSQSECGQERVYQGSVVHPRWPVTLSPGVRMRINFTWYVRQLSAG